MPNRYAYEEKDGPCDGTMMAVLLRDGLMVGYVWWRKCGRCCEILYLWLDDQVRGHGRMRRLFRWLCDQHKFRVVTTKAGNSFGKPWLERNGFQERVETSDWALVFSR